MKSLKTLALPVVALGLAAFALAGQFAAPIAAETPPTDGVPDKTPTATGPGPVTAGNWQETDFNNPGTGQGHPTKRR
jgi:hypothetical protein